MNINYRRYQKTDIHGLIKLMFELGYPTEEGEFKARVVDTETSST